MIARIINSEIIKHLRINLELLVLLSISTGCWVDTRHVHCVGLGLGQQQISKLEGQLA